MNTEPAGYPPRLNVVASPTYGEEARARAALGIPKRSRSAGAADLRGGDRGRGDTDEGRVRSRGRSRAGVSTSSSRNRWRGVTGREHVRNAERAGIRWWRTSPRAGPRSTAPRARSSLGTIGEVFHITHAAGLPDGWRSLTSATATPAFPDRGLHHHFLDASALTGRSEPRLLLDPAQAGRSAFAGTARHHRAGLRGRRPAGGGGGGTTRDAARVGDELPHDGTLG